MFVLFLSCGFIVPICNAVEILEEKEPEIVPRICNIAGTKIKRPGRYAIPDSRKAPVSISPRAHMDRINTLSRINVKSSDLFFFFKVTVAPI